MVYCFEEVYNEKEEMIEIFIKQNRLLLLLLGIKNKMDKKKVIVVLLILALVFAVVTVFISLNAEGKISKPESSFSNSNSGNIQLIVEGGDVENAER